jgi:AraC-like DNA-binding protein
MVFDHGGFNGDRPAAQQVRRPVSATMRRVARHIEENYTENVSLRELAQLAALSPCTLVNLFRREVGIPPHQYLCYVRIREAMALLRGGSSAAAAAIDAGFFDQSHLTRHFKRMCGMTPGQYVASMIASASLAAIQDGRPALC